MKPIATNHFTNSSGIAIYDITDETVKSAFINNKGLPENMRVTKLHHHNTKGPYIIRGNRKHYLSTFMKV